MSMIICYGARPRILAALQTYLNGLTLRLYLNNHVPADSDTVSSYTEANFTGYAAIALTSWGTAFLNGSNLGEIDHPTQTFTQTGTGTTCMVYGYYVTDGSGNLIWAELNSAGPFNMNASGLTYTVAPILTDDDI